ncbi:GNAT family N-acetyltransferase, partial [Thioclava sp. BHET1]
AYFIAEDGGHPLGFAVTRAGDPGSGTVCLHRIAVAETGAGVGSRFLTLLCDRVFKDADIDRLWLNVLAVNHGARHVYARTGFREEGYLRKALRRPDGRREDLILMAMLREDRSQPA